MVIYFGQRLYNFTSAIFRFPLAQPLCLLSAGRYCTENAEVPGLVLFKFKRSGVFRVHDSAPEQSPVLNLLAICRDGLIVNLLWMEGTLFNTLIL